MFTYCNNNPTNFSDFSGKVPALLFVATLVVTAVINTNHFINSVNEIKINKEISDTYTKDAAAYEINQILNKYSNDAEIEFDLIDEHGNYYAEITDSYKVTSRYDRQKISAIIGKTGVTTRQNDDIAAEWVFHNISTCCSATFDQGKDAGLDYEKDRRWLVRLGTDILEFFGWL